MKPIDLLFLSQEDVVSTGLTMKETIGIVEETFEAHGSKLYENPPKPGIHPKDDAFIHAMPAYLKGKAIAGMKWVSGYSSNVRCGLPTIMGMIVLNAVDTGQPLAIMEGGLITAMRTAAVSGVSAKYLAVRGASTIGIVGAGVQGRYHLSALKAVLPGIKTVKVFDIDETTLQWYVERFDSAMPFKVEAARSAEDTIIDADVIVTATGKLESAVYKAEWVKAGALILPVHMFGWDRKMLTAADKFIVDDWAQIDSYLREHAKFYLPLPELFAELGELVVGQKRAREGSKETIINFNLGVAIHDIAVASAVLSRARKSGLGINLQLMRNTIPFAVE
jgi:ornithine cyclodeaminase/alanine dehydrogenase